MAEPAQVEAPDSEPSIRGRRGPATTILQARTGLALLNGAPSTYRAMREAGYSEATAKNPAANGVTPAVAIAAANEVFPEAASASSIKRDGLELVQAAIQRVKTDKTASALDLAQIGGSAAKLGHDIGGSDELDVDLQAGASLEAFNVRLAQVRLETAQRITAPDADVLAIVDELQQALDDALGNQQQYELAHRRMVRR